MTPLGIGAGWLLTSAITGSFSQILQSNMQAFACGSFIYLALHEISDTSCCRVVSNGAQIGLMFSGIAAMAVLAVWT
jgi:hypothetical protein